MTMGKVNIFGIINLYEEEGPEQSYVGHLTAVSRSSRAAQHPREPQEHNQTGRSLSQTWGFPYLPECAIDTFDVRVAESPPQQQYCHASTEIPSIVPVYVPPPYMFGDVAVARLVPAAR